MLINILRNNTINHLITLPHQTTKTWLLVPFRFCSGQCSATAQSVLLCAHPFVQQPSSEKEITLALKSSNLRCNYFLVLILIF